MITLKLHYEPPFNILTKKIDEKIEIEENIKLMDLIDYLKGIYGNDFKDLVFDKKKNGEISSFVSIIINGRSYRHEKFFETLLKDDDDVSFIYIYFGG